MLTKTQQRKILQIQIINRSITIMLLLQTQIIKTRFNKKMKKDRSSANLLFCRFRTSTVSPCRLLPTPPLSSTVLLFIVFFWVSWLLYLVYLTITGSTFTTKTASKDSKSSPTFWSSCTSSMARESCLITCPCLKTWPSKLLVSRSTTKTTPVKGSFWLMRTWRTWNRTLSLSFLSSICFSWSFLCWLLSLSRCWRNAHRNQKKVFQIWQLKTRSSNNIKKAEWLKQNLTRHLIRTNSKVMSLLCQFLSRKNLQSHIKYPYRPMTVLNSVFKKMMKRRNLPECHWFSKVSLITSKNQSLSKISSWHWSEPTWFSSPLRSVCNWESSSHSSLLTLSTWSSLSSVVWSSSSCFVSYWLWVRSWYRLSK